MRKDGIGPGPRENFGRYARAEAATGRQCGMVWRNQRRHTKRVHRSLRMYLGYDEREGE